MGQILTPKWYHPDFSQAGVKPTGPIEIDWTNPIAGNLTHVYLFQEGGGDTLNLVSGRLATNTGIDYNATKHGWEVSPNSNTDDFTETLSDRGLSDSSDFTVFTIAKTSTPSSGRRLLQYGPNLLGTSGGLYVSHSTSGGVQVGVGSSTGFTSNTSSSGFWDTTDYNTNAVSVKGTEVSCYKEGGLHDTFSLLAARNANADTTMTLFQRQDNASGRNWDGDTRLIYVWKSALTSAQVASLTRDPYQVLKPAVPQTFYFPPGSTAKPLVLPKWYHPDFSQPGVKPTGPVEMDTSTFDPMFLWYEGRDLVSAMDRTSDVSTGGTKQAGRNGRCHNYTGAGYDLFSGTGQDLSGEASCTYVGQIDTSVIDGNRVFFSHPVSFGVLTSGIIIWADNSGFNTSNADCLSIALDGARVETDANSIAIDKLLNIVLTWRGGTDCSVYINGEKVSSGFASGTPNTFATLDGSYRIGGHGSLDDHIGNIYLSALSKEGVSDGRARELSLDPYQILKPAVETLYFPASAAGGGDTNVLATTDSLTLTEQGATVNAETNVAATTDALTLTEQSASITLGLDVKATTDALTLSEQAADIALDKQVSATTDALVLTEQAATISLHVDVAATTDTLVLSEQAATVTLVDTGNDTNVLATTASLTITEKAATISAATNVNANSDSLILSEHAAQVGLSTNISAGTDNLVIVEQSAAITLPRNITASTDLLIISELAATITATQGVDIPIDGGASVIIDTGYQSHTLYYNGSAYFTID